MPHACAADSLEPARERNRLALPISKISRRSVRPRHVLRTGREQQMQAWLISGECGCVAVVRVGSELECSRLEVFVFDATWLAPNAGISEEAEYCLRSGILEADIADPQE